MSQLLARGGAVRLVGPHRRRSRPAARLAALDRRVGPDESGAPIVVDGHRSEGLIGKFARAAGVPIGEFEVAPGRPSQDEARQRSQD